ncbi:D-glucuronyl C5-epimerase family protein [Micromonospora aurantiaca (nom. illeg.)]
MSGVTRFAGTALRNLRVQRVPALPRPDPAGRGGYPLVWPGLPRQTRVDGSGVVVATGPDGTPFPNPVSMCLYAMSEHGHALHAGPDERAGRVEAFLTQARWLRRHQDAQGGWRYPVPVPRYGVAPGWYSGMAQGLAASTFLRAHDLTGEDSYLDAADGAVALLLRPLAAGGCADYDVASRPFLEECAAEPANHVLNGAVFALFGLTEHQNRRDGTAHLAATDRLVEELDSYDIGYWSRYDQRLTSPATPSYHLLHVSLLTAAARLTGRAEFLGMARRWRAQARNPVSVVRAGVVKASHVWRYRDV